MHVRDHDRPDRIGMPEAVLCSSKSDAQLRVILGDLIRDDHRCLLTRLDESRWSDLPAQLAARLDYDSVSRTAVLGGNAGARAGRVAVVAAGTSDQGVAAEASRTLGFSGVAHEEIIDVGVAGLWRLERRLADIRRADVVIIVAGLDAALVSVVGGLVAAPVIAVPTSVGYGVATGGSVALNSSLASCAQGVVVVNIDNGFGGACAAVRVLGLLSAPQDPAQTTEGPP